MPRLYTEDRIAVEVICARTHDGVLHSGALIQAEKPNGPPVAVLWIHGGARNFYYPSYLRIGQTLAARGVAFVSGNTRGRDVGAVVRWDDALDRPVLGGAAWERFDEGVLDLAAWVDRISDLGYPRVVLVGHSMGGWRVAQYQASHSDARVGGLVLASTPLAPPDPQRHSPELVELAERMVVDGHGDDLLPPERLGHHQSASGFLRLREVNLDLYGMRSGEALLAHVGCPVLAWFGTDADEARLGSVADLDTARRSLPATTRFETRLIEGANHMYNGHEGKVARILSEWIRGLDPPKPSHAS